MSHSPLDRAVPSLFYEHRVERYDTPVNRRFYQSIATGLLDMLSDDRMDTVLEIGAGTGFATTLLRQRHPKAKIVALEPAPAMAERGRGRVPDAEWLLEPVSRIASCHVDLVFSSMSYHWLSESERLKLAGSASQGRFAIAAAVTNHSEPAAKPMETPDGNARLKHLVYRLRPKTPWGRRDRRTDLLVEALGRNFRRIDRDHLTITETFADTRDLADTLYGRGTLLALFGGQVDDAHRELARCGDNGTPISFRWQIALITGSQSSR